MSAATTKYDALSAKVDSLADTLAQFIATQMASKVEAPKVPQVRQTVSSVDVSKLSHATVRTMCQSRHLPVSAKGITSAADRAGLAAAMAGELTDAPVQAPVQGRALPITGKAKSPARVAVVQGRPLPEMSARKRDGVVLRDEDVSEILATHPMAQAVLLVPAGSWWAMNSMGAPVKVNGKPTADLQPNPAGLSGFDRMVARWLALKPGTAAKPRSLAQGCNVLMKMAAAGFIIPGYRDAA